MRVASITWPVRHILSHVGVQVHFALLPQLGQDGHGERLADGGHPHDAPSPSQQPVLQVSISKAMLPHLFSIDTDGNGHSRCPGLVHLHPAKVPCLRNCSLQFLSLSLLPALVIGGSNQTQLEVTSIRITEHVSGAAIGCKLFTSATS